jgi:hypothetical protein
VSDRIVLDAQLFWELIKKSAVTTSNFAVCTLKKPGVMMNAMSEKPIYRILNVVSLLALTYYAATSINYIVESDAQIYSYDSQTNSDWLTAKLEAHRSGK